MYEDLTDKLSALYDLKVYGPYVRKDDNRVYFVLADIYAKKSIMLARALMEIKLGRKLTTEEHVDHINGDSTDDRAENLQVLSVEEHRIKSGIENRMRQSKRTFEKCPCCETLFECASWRKLKALARNRFPTCSRTCASLYYGANQHKDWSK